MLAKNMELKCPICNESLELIDGAKIGFGLINSDGSFPESTSPVFECKKRNKIFDEIDIVNK